jgi:protocatechuate 3,4-dioxygenase beta subunit
VTDERGRYSFARLAPDRYWPGSVLRAGYAFPRRDYDEEDALDLRRSAAATRDFLLTRLSRLPGRVRDERGRPIAEALVVLEPKGVPTVYRGNFAGGELARTRGDGTFSLAYDPAELEGETAHTLDRALLVLKRGYAATRLEAVDVGAAARPLVVTLARGVPLSGRVLGENGAPLPDVGVLIAEDSAVSGAIMPAHAFLARLSADGWVKTGPDGLFTARVRPGLHDLSFRKPGYSPKVVAAHDPASALEVSLIPSAALRGIVVSHDGRGVPGVGIHVVQPGGLHVSSRTAEDGTFALDDLSPGPYDLWATKENTGIRATRRGEAPAPDVRIELGPLGALRGRVADARTGAPVTRFTVTAGGSEAEAREGFQTQEVSDADGAFVLEDLSVGDVSVTVEAEGYLRQEASGVVSSGGEEAPPLEIALEAGVALSGRVTTTAGEPLADARVSASGGGPDSEASTESDEKGNYTLSGVRPGTVTVQFQRSGYVSVRKSFDTADTTRADAALARGLSLRGRVVSGGVGVARAHVAATSSAVDAQDASGFSDEGGAFTLDGLTPGPYTIRASSREGDEATLENVDAETSGPLRLVLERKPTAVVSGTVTGLPLGDPEVVVRVTVFGEDGRNAEAPVDGRGAFRVEKAPAGRVRVQAFANSISGSERSSRANELTLAPASESQTVLEFSNDIVITGRVTRDGAPLARAAVFFHASDATRNMASARATESGDYEVVGMEPGPYSVTVSDGLGFSFSTECLVRQSARFDIDATGASLRGMTVDAADGSAVGGVDISFWREGETRPTTSRQANAKGEFTVRSLREGRYRVVTSKRGFGQEVREVHLEPGSSAELVLELSASDGLSLSVVDARDNRPLDATVVVRDLAKRVVANQHSGVGVDGMLNIPLAPGRYLLSTSADGYGTATVPVTAPGQGFRVGLTPGGTLVLVSERDLRGRIRLVKPDGEEYVQCWCNGIADIQLTGRHTRVANVTAGAYTLELLDHAGVARRGPTVVIEESQTATIEIE